MKDNLKVSVVIPVYNSSRFIKKCLDSVVNQTLPKNEFEILVVDDCSTDDTVAVIRNYMDLYPNILLFQHAKNSKLGAARNTGIRNAAGEFLFFVDADDFIRDDTLEILLNEQAKENVDLVFSDIERVDPFYQTSKIYYRQHTTIDIQADPSLFIFPSVCNILIRNELLTRNQILFEENILHEDILFFFKIMLNVSSISSTRQTTYFYISQENSIVNTYSSFHTHGILNAFAKVYDYLVSLNILELRCGLWKEIFIRYLRLAVVPRIAKMTADPQAYYQDLYRQLEETGLYSKLNAPDDPVIIDIRNRAASLQFPEPFHEIPAFLAQTPYKFDHTVDPDLQSITVHIFTENDREEAAFCDRLVEFLNHNQNISWQVQKADGQVMLHLQKRRLVTASFLRQYCLNKLVFICHLDGHIRFAAQIIRELQKRGINAFILDITRSKCFTTNRPMSLLEKKNHFSDIEILEFEVAAKEVIPLYAASAIVFSIDWGVVRQTLYTLNSLGVPTIALYEGINDDFNIGAPPDKELPYRACRYIFVPGEYYRSLYGDKPLVVGGLPALRKLLDKPVNFPLKPIVAINDNFTGKALEDKRQVFLETAVEACRLAGVDYVITRHPADNADLSRYHTSDRSLVEVIESCSMLVSSFSTAILESLALGKPAVYHNPHGERFDKFIPPLGAYEVSTSAEGLAAAICLNLEKIKNGVNIREKARDFLQYHTNIFADRPPEVILVDSIESILNENRSSFLERKDFLLKWGAEMMAFLSGQDELIHIREELEDIQHSRWWRLRGFVVRVINALKRGIQPS